MDITNKGDRYVSLWQAQIQLLPMGVNSAEMARILKRGEIESETLVSAKSLAAFIAGPWEGCIYGHHCQRPCCGGQEVQTFPADWRPYGR